LKPGHNQFQLSVSRVHPRSLYAGLVLAGRCAIVGCGVLAYTTAAGDDAEKTEPMVTMHPAPVLPAEAGGGVKSDVLGESFRGPGPYPDTLTTALIRFQSDALYAPNGSSVGVMSWSGSPVTLNWANKGDIDVNLSPNAPSDQRNDLQHPVWGFQRTVSGTTAVRSGPPTYAWGPNPARGMVLTSVYGLREGTGHGYVETHLAGLGTPSRSGPAYSMVSGQWGPGHAEQGEDIFPSHLWVVAQEIGSERETYTDFAFAWLPSEDGWVSGFLSAAPEGYGAMPLPEQIPNDAQLETIEGMPESIAYRRNAAGTKLPWLASERAFDTYSVITGVVDLPAGAYTIAATGDDGFKVEIERTDEAGQRYWQRVAGISGVHGAKRDMAKVVIEERSRWRVSHYQESQGWTLEITLTPQMGGHERHMRFVPGSVEVQAFATSQLDRRDAPWYVEREQGEMCRSEAMAAAQPHWQEADDFSQPFAVAEIPGDAIPAESGALFVEPVTNNAAMLSQVWADGNDWVVQIEDAAVHETGYPGASMKRWGFGFVHIPYDRKGVLAAHVHGGTGGIVEGGAGLQARRVSRGRFEITPPESAQSGTVFLQVVAQDAAQIGSLQRVFGAWEQGDDGRIQIEFLEIHPDGGPPQPRDTSFYFVYFPNQGNEYASALLASPDE